MDWNCFIMANFCLEGSTYESANTNNFLKGAKFWSWLIRVWMDLINAELVVMIDFFWKVCPKKRQKRAIFKTSWSLIITDYDLNESDHGGVWPGSLSSLLIIVWKGLTINEPIKHFIKTRYTLILADYCLDGSDHCWFWPECNWSWLFWYLEGFSNKRAKNEPL